jgi:hypothetical protein
MACKKVNDKKYLERNSPPFHANECKEVIKKGNDGKMYISKKDKNNVYKWIIHNPDLMEPILDAKKHKGKLEYGVLGKGVYLSVEKSDGEWIWKEQTIKMKKTPDDYFKQFPKYEKPYYNTTIFTKNISKLKTEMANIGVLFYYLKWGKDSLYVGHHSYVMELVDKEIDKNPKKYPNGYFFYSDYLLWDNSLIHNDKDDGKMFLSFSINSSIKEKFNDLLIRIFPKRTLGFLNVSDSIVIYFEEKDNLIKLKPKDHTEMYTIIKFKNQKLDLPESEYYKLSKEIEKKIGKKYIFDLSDLYFRKGKLTLFLKIYNDKIKEFTEKMKTLKLSNRPEINEIGIWYDDPLKKNEHWIFKFK